MSFYDEESWQKFREEAIDYSVNLERTVLKEWLDEIGYTDPVGYYRDTINNVMKLYSTRIGLLIGKGGTNVEKLQKMLFDKYAVQYKITFFEISGGFVNV